MNFFTFRILTKRIAAIRHLMADKSVPKRKKFLVIFGIFYLLMPLDLIPAVLFPIAWMDDLLLWIYIIWNLKDYLDRYWMGDPSVDLSKKFKNKTMVEDVDFTVKPETGKGNDTPGKDI